jgi:subtilisin inhibitor-like
MRRVALTLLLVAAVVTAGGCFSGSVGSGGVGVAAAPPTHVEVTYFGALHRACPTNDLCGVLPLQRITCPKGSRCVPPVPQAELVACPRGARPGIHCYAIPPTLSRGPKPDPWVILQQRELSCSPARGGYANPAAACRALADYLPRLRTRGPNMCMCPYQLWQTQAVGTFRGRPVSADLSACATCGLGRAAIADRDTLTPALGS